MNEFLCHKFLITDNESPDRRNDFYSVIDARGELMNVNTSASVKENQHRLLISDVGSRQYKTWLKKIDRPSIRETRQSPQRRGHTRTPRPPRRSSNSIAFKYRHKPDRKEYEKFMATKNGLEFYEKPFFVSKNRFRNNWNRQKKKTFYKKLRQPQFYRIYGRESVSSNAPPSPPPLLTQSSSSADKDKNTPWYVSTEPTHFTNNGTVKMNYNFWDMNSGPTPPPPPPPPLPPTAPMPLSYGPHVDCTSYEPSPPFCSNEITPQDYSQSDDSPVLWPSSPGQKWGCDDDENDDDDDDNTDDSDNSSGDGPLANLLRNDMYHTVVIVFAFIGFATFFMNMMSGLNSGNNSQMPSIMFVGNNNEEDDQGAGARKLTRVKHEIHLNNLMERSFQYIEQFQEILSSMSDGKTSTSRDENDDNSRAHRIRGQVVWGREK